MWNKNSPSRRALNGRTDDSELVTNKWNAGASRKIRNGARSITAVFCRRVLFLSIFVQISLVNLLYYSLWVNETFKFLPPCSITPRNINIHFRNFCIDYFLYGIGTLIYTLSYNNLHLLSYNFFPSLLSFSNLILNSSSFVSLSV